MSPSLPPRPSLEWLRKTTKDRLVLLRQSEPHARLADAQRAVAREYGFPSWRALKSHIEATTAEPGARTADPTIGIFLQHVGKGRLDDVRAMLAASPRLVNAVGPHPFWGGHPQALHVAIEGGRRDLFDLLLENGADVNGSNDQYDHWSPLMISIHADQTEMQDELLRSGARVGLVEALMLADDDRVDALLRSGGLPDVVPNSGSLLAFARTPYAVDRLIELGAKTDAKDRWGTTPVEAMSRLGVRGRALVQHMISRGVPAHPKEYARLGDTEMLSRLIAGDPAVARLDSVMMAAVASGHHTLVTWLLERGGNANARSDDSSRHTALHSAAWSGDLSMARTLVAAGADVTARDEQYDATPLGWAKTSIEVSNNPKCEKVVAYLEAVTRGDVSN